MVLEHKNLTRRAPKAIKPPTINCFYGAYESLPDIRLTTLGRLGQEGDINIYIVFVVMFYIHNLLKPE